MAANTAIIAEYSLKFSEIKRLLFSKIDIPLNIIGVKTTKGMYANKALILGDKFFGIIPDSGIDLIKKVKKPHKIIANQVIALYPIFWLQSLQINQ